VTALDEHVASGTLLPLNLDEAYANGIFMDISRENSFPKSFKDTGTEASRPHLMFLN
jgi:hypothetical protein